MCLSLSLFSSALFFASSFSLPGLPSLFRLAITAGVIAWVITTSSFPVRVMEPCIAAALRRPMPPINAAEAFIQAAN